MNVNNTINLIIINNNILNNKNGDTYSSFFINNLNNLGYKVKKIIIIPDDVRIILKEINYSNQEYDITLIISNLSQGIVNEVLGKVFKCILIRNVYLENTLRSKNITYNEKEIFTLPYINVVESEKYPLLHIQRFFLIHEEYMDSIFRGTLKNYLTNNIKSMVFKKIANIYLNGNHNEINKLNRGPVRFTLDQSTSNSVQLKYESESLEEIIEFEYSLKSLAFVSSTKPILQDSFHVDDNIHLRNSIQVIESCFEKYGPENTFISFNGGKDCTVLLHLMLLVLEKQYPCYSKKPLCLYVQSNQPFDEQEEFIAQCQQFYSLEVITLQKDIKHALEIILQDHPNLKACLMGTRKTDPFSESLSEFQMTDKGYPEVMRVNPLLNWRYFHIWDYLLYHKIPYCKLYDMGYTSIGNRNNTTRNLFLLLKECCDEEDEEEDNYLPAFKLLDENSERSGRVS